LLQKGPKNSQRLRGWRLKNVGRTRKRYLKKGQAVANKFPSGKESQTGKTKNRKGEKNERKDSCQGLCPEILARADTNRFFEFDFQRVLL
jgi:hypothetical protein